MASAREPGINYRSTNPKYWICVRRQMKLSPAYLAKQFTHLWWAFCKLGLWTIGLISNYWEWMFLPIANPMSCRTRNLSRHFRQGGLNCTGLVEHENRAWMRKEGAKVVHSWHFKDPFLFFVFQCQPSQFHHGGFSSSSGHSRSLRFRFVFVLDVFFFFSGRFGFLAPWVRSGLISEDECLLFRLRIFAHIPHTLR